MKILNDYLESLMIGQVNEVEYEVNVAAGVIVRLDGNMERQVLLIQRAADDHWPSAWEFPRGKCDRGPNEKIFSCLKREIKEETGLDVIPLRFIGEFEYLADRGKRKSIQFNYLCRMKNPEQSIKLSKEHQGYRWVKTAGEVELMVNAGEMKRTLLKAFDYDHKMITYPESEIEPVESIEESLNNYLGKV
jgi:8-oxo-dGTP pyrophosphatase MutT (NUDIX family)